MYQRINSKLFVSVLLLGLFALGLGCAPTRPGTPEINENVKSCKYRLDASSKNNAIRSAATIYHMCDLSFEEFLSLRELRGKEY